MNLDLISSLFNKKLQSKIEMVFPFTQTFLLEDEVGNQISKKEVKNNIRVTLEKEVIDSKRFMTLSPEHGVSYIACLSNRMDEIPVMLDVIGGECNARSAEDLAELEVEYLIEKFIRGVVHNG